MYAIDRPLDYFVVQGPQPTGRSLGLFAGRDISETIVDMFGNRYAFVGLAPRKWNGELDAKALGTGEFIVLPGLLYRREDARQKGWFALWP